MGSRIAHGCGVHGCKHNRGCSSKIECVCFSIWTHFFVVFVFTLIFRDVVNIALHSIFTEYYRILFSSKYKYIGFVVKAVYGVSG